MTNQISFPPLHDLSPEEHETRKQHLLSEIRRAPEGRRLSLPTVPPVRLRVTVPAAAAVCVAAACAVFFSGALGGSGTHHTSVFSAQNGRTTSWSAYGGPLQFSPLALDFTRGDQGLSAIGMTVNAATLGGTAELQVVRGDLNAPEDAAPSQVVFHEQVPMTNVSSPRSGPPGTVVLSTWSGTLSPREWAGGCQSGPYVITVKVSPAHPTVEAQGESVESGSFSCRSGFGGSK